MKKKRSNLNPSRYITCNYLLHCPERSLSLLVHLPDIRMLDGEDDKPSGVLPEKRFVLGFCASLVALIFFPEAILQRTNHDRLAFLLRYKLVIQLPYE